MNGLRTSRGLALTVGCLLLCLFFLCGLGYASGGGENNGTHDSGRLVDLLYRCINFALLVIILFVVIRKTAIKDFFSMRREEIKKRFADLNREKDEAEARYGELEEKLKAFEIKKKEIIEQFKAEGAAEKEKIIAQAKERATHILTQADLTIEREIKAAKDRLRQEVVNIAAQRAQEIIAKEIKESDEDQLVKEFIEKVEKLN
jgi:F-type H+-transporting ATPase subunit b